VVIELAPEMASVAQRTARLLGKTYLPVLGDAEIEGYNALSLSFAPASRVVLRAADILW